MRPITPLVASDFRGRAQRMIQRFEVNIDGAWVDLTGYESVTPIDPDVVNTNLVVQDMAHAHTANNVILFYNTAGVVYAASCEYADVAAAIAAADPYDTVMVPAGSATWGSRLLITKPLIIRGAGIGSTNITSGYVAPTDDANDPRSCLVYYNPGVPDSNHLFRLAGFSFDCASGCGVVYLKHSTSVGNEVARNVRIDHNEFNNILKAPLGFRPIYFYGHFAGVVDNNIGTNCNGLARGLGCNMDTWTNMTYAYGTADQLYFEDNVMDGPASYIVGATGAGARFCARYNTFTKTNTEFFSVFDTHGNQPGGYGATMGAVVYNNTFILGGAYTSGRLGDWRGGRVMSYNNNIVTPYGTSVGGGAFREEYNDGYHSPYEASDGQPMHVSDGYFWSNTRNGSTLIMPGITSTVDYSDPAKAGYTPALAYKGVVPRWDVHGWKHVAAFDGSTGMGVGLRSARPAREDMSGAPVGVAWWATDESKLYRWNGTVWVQYYAPYTYPHPLRSDPVLGD